MRKPSRTSSFGVSKRESHDASAFYARRLYQPDPGTPAGGNPADGGPAASGLGNPARDAPAGPPAAAGEAPLPPEARNQVIAGDSRSMGELPDGCVHLMVTSPPYNVGKDYDEDLTLDEYRDLLRDVFRETYRVLAPGGRACVNVANLGRRPYLPLHSFIIEDMLALGFLMRGEIIWNKAASSGGSTAWGSWMSASNPTLRDVHEYILVFSKPPFGRPANGRTSTITRDEFLEYTKSVWEFPSESARRVGHPAPFPVELPRRLIQLYTFLGDVVLDPFCGSGSTCIAALETGRDFVGYDINPEYVELARRRIEAAQRAVPARPLFP